MPDHQSKSRHDENFPVGSWLISTDLRPTVHAYYRFARLADDVADSHELAPETKLAHLNEMERVLLNPEGYTDGSETLTAAFELRTHLTARGLALNLATDLLAAFKRDATNERCRTWADLMDYCRLSACPVGRFLLALHGEQDGREASDALCSALQVVNHLQDVKDDYTMLHRVYLPADWLATDGVDLSELSAASTSPGLRKTLTRVTEYTEDLIARAEHLPAQLDSRRLAAESAVCVRLARHLNHALRARDPLAQRVALKPIHWFSAGLSGLKQLLAL